MRCKRTRARVSGNVINETLMIFIVSKPIIIRDAFYSSINRRKTLLLVPTLRSRWGVSYMETVGTNSHNQSC